jgi:hypothetical protein
VSIEPGNSPYGVTPPLDSERVVLAAPMSFAGSTRRLCRALQPRIDQSYGWRMAAWWTLLVTVLVLAWAGVLVWYCLWGLLLVPYRIIRRGQRKRDLAMLRHREMMSAIQNNRPGRGDR